MTDIIEELELHGKVPGGWYKSRLADGAVH